MDAKSKFFEAELLEGQAASAVESEPRVVPLEEDSILLENIKYTEASSEEGVGFVDNGEPLHPLDKAIVLGLWCVPLSCAVCAFSDGGPRMQ